MLHPVHPVNPVYRVQKAQQTGCTGWTGWSGWSPHSSPLFPLTTHLSPLTSTIQADNGPTYPCSIIAGAGRIYYYKGNGELWYRTVEVAFYQIAADGTWLLEGLDGSTPAFANPIPAGAPVGSLRTRLAGLVTRACTELGWIPSPPLCASLTSVLTGPLRLADFLALLSANRGAGVQRDDNPCYLLMSTRDYIRSLVGLPQFGLVYVCGNKFNARNRLDVLIPATWTSLTSSASGAASRWRLGPPAPSTARRSRSRPGRDQCVRLRFDGQVVGEINPETRRLRRARQGRYRRDGGAG